MNSETPIEQASKGAVKGLLDWSAEKIDKESTNAIAYIKGSLPDVFVLASKLSAMEKCKSIIENIRPQIEDDYRLETINEQDEYVVFIKRKISTEIPEPQQPKLTANP